jgi:hypothetical protein
MAALPESIAAGHAPVQPGDVVVLEQGDGQLGAAAATATEAGLQVLFARAREADRDRPFAVARRLFAPALEGLGPAERSAAFAGNARLAAFVFSEERPPELEAIHGLYWLATNLAARSPLAIIVEGAQWADEPSLRVCRYLEQRIDELPVALVVARQP